MKFDNDSDRPSLDMVMHVLVAAIFLATVVATVDWTGLLDALV